ncbi:hypothetical protein [uncultured Eubacterium sp.]|uniref:hypothetical protein n=1 Tax=uncultured Eubacterium sp. TaxID=165185 RepID=UPI0015ADAFD3|nr:hypothetical protein [uncultured Eubacterium sp.]
MKNEAKQKNEKNFIPGTKVSKVGVIITSVILAVLIALSTFFVVVFSAQPYELKDGQLDVYKLTSTIYTKMIVAAMPETIHDEDTGIDFYIEVNDNYDYHYNQPIEQYSVYYYDKDENKIYLDAGVYEDNNYNINNRNSKNALMGFFISGMDSIKKIKTVVTVILVLLVIAILALLTYLITMIVRVKRDREYYQYKSKKKAEKENK